MDYDQLHTQAMLPCVRIRAGAAGGSGTVIYSAGDSTYILTNHHVVDNLIKVEKKWDPVLQQDVKKDTRGIPDAHFFRYQYASRATGGTNIECDIAAYDEDEDLALLKLRSDEPPPAVAKLLPPGGETSLRVGHPIVTVGAGLGEPPMPTWGSLSAFGREIAHKEFWLNSAPSIFGNSGGACFLRPEAGLDDDYLFIGVPARIAVSGLFGADAITHLSYAIPMTRVYEFLEAQCFRFIYDDAFTEEGEEKERRKRREKVRDDNDKDPEEDSA